MRKIIPAGPSLVVLIGPTAAGKSHFAGVNFNSGEVVSTDAIRIEFTGDLGRQDKNDEVFEEFHRRIEVKIRVGQRVIADATNIRNKDRRMVAEIGKMLNVPVTYVVINRPVKTKFQQGGYRLNWTRKGRPLIEAMEETFMATEETILLGDHGLADQVIDTRTEEFEVARLLPRSYNSSDVLNHLLNGGYEYVRVIGDVHGNLSGYAKALQGVDDRGVTYLLSLGDVVDYGRHTLTTAEITHHFVQQGQGTMIRGNHERKIRNWVVGERKEGFKGHLSFGNDVTTNQLKSLPPTDRAFWEDRFLGLVEMSPDWVQIGDNHLFVHGAAHPRMWGNTTFRAPPNSGMEANALFGETTGETDPQTGFPIRKYDWVHELEAGREVVVGHAIMSTEAPTLMRGRNGGIAIFMDTGSGKEGGKLSWMDYDIVKTRRGPRLEFRGLQDEHGNVLDFIHA